MVSADHSSRSHEQLGHPNRITAGDLFVVVATAIVTMAVMVGLSAQLGLDVQTSAGVSIVSFIAMVAGHAALRRSEAQQKSLRLAAKLKRPNAQTEAQSPSQPAPGQSGKPDILPEACVPDLDHKVEKVVAPVQKGAFSELGHGPSASSQSASSQPPPLQPAPGEFGRVRPRTLAGLPAESDASGNAGKANSSTIDAMIKRLANDIEAGRKELPESRGHDAAPTFATLEMLPAVQARPQQPAMLPPAPSFGAPTFGAPTFGVPGLGDFGSAIVEPVANKKPQPTPSKHTLHSLPPTMMEAARNVPPAPTLPSPPSATAKLAAIADALSDEQLDVFLETINGLEDFRAQHYEVSVRIRLADDTSLDNTAFIAETRGTGLLPLLEAVKVSSTKRLAVQMMNRGRTGEFFTAVDGEALSEQQFGADVETITSGDQTLAARLVLAFTQADVRSLTPAQIRTMDAIVALGFRFSVEAITDLDMDFEALAKRGFAFAKLDAAVFLDGLPIGTVRVPSHDICKHLGGAGLVVIVGKIADEASRARIANCGARLGQGALFGLPRPVRSNVLRPTEQPAASV